MYGFSINHGWSPVPSAANRSPTSSPEESARSEEHTSELQSPDHLVCRLLLEKKNNLFKSSCLSGENEAPKLRVTFVPLVFSKRFMTFFVRANGLLYALYHKSL